MQDMAWQMLREAVTPLAKLDHDYTDVDGDDIHCLVDAVLEVLGLTGSEAVLLDDSAE